MFKGLITVAEQIHFGHWQGTERLFSQCIQSLNLLFRQRPIIDSDIVHQALVVRIGGEQAAADIIRGRGALRR